MNRKKSDEENKLKARIKNENNHLMRNIKQVITDYVAEEIDNLNDDDSAEMKGIFIPKMKHRIPFDKLNLDIQYQLENIDLVTLQNERDIQDKNEME